MQIKTGVCGFYKLSKGREVDGEIVVEELTGWFPNLITNYGMNWLAGEDQNWSYAFVGSGNIPPSAEDVQLGNRLSRASETGIRTSFSIEFDGERYYRKGVFQYRFLQGWAAGNISEIGISTSSTTSSYNLCSRALVKDTEGHTITITILDDEYLYLDYEFRHYLFAGDSTGTVQFTGNIGGTYDYILRGLAIGTKHSSIIVDGIVGLLKSNQYSRGTIGNGTIGEAIGFPTFTQSASLPRYGYAMLPYTANSFTRSCRYSFTPTEANFSAGINLIRLNLGVQLYQMSITPTIMKNSLQVLSFTFTISWERFNPPTEIV